ncbi:hypothetical protein APHAL10511_001380 [Amanita phalloides]|nr:hypothetical protein APHAL10511_001380 [Amanita phalloides]
MVAHHTHDTCIYALRACPFSYGRDLIALGGERGVDILMADDSDCRVIASFHTGCRVTALAWSPKSVSPSSNNEWILELVAAGSDYGMYLLKKTPTSEESIFRFGGGLTGHHGRVNDIAFCGGHGENGQRYVGSVSDDKMLMVWDLYPNVPVQLQQERPQPTAYAITFSHALVSIDAHVSSNKEFLVADCKGSVYITDWRTDPENSGRLGFHNSNILELTDSSALVSSAGLTGSASWRPDNADVTKELVPLLDPGFPFGISEIYKADSHREMGSVFRTVVIIFAGVLLIQNISQSPQRLIRTP